MSFETYDWPEENVKPIEENKTPEQELNEVDKNWEFWEFLYNLEHIDKSQLDEKILDVINRILERANSDIEEWIMLDVDYIIWKNISSNLTPENIEKSLNQAIELAAEEIKIEHKNITSSQAMNNALNEIKSPNIKTKMEGLKSLYLLANTSDWFSKNATNEKKTLTVNKYRTDFMKRISYIEDLISHLHQRLELAQKEWNTKQEELIAKNIEVRESELWELKTWGIFTWNQSFEAKEEEIV